MARARSRRPIRAVVGAVRRMMVVLRRMEEESCDVDGTDWRCEDGGWGWRIWDGEI